MARVQKLDNGDWLIDSGMGVSYLSYMTELKPNHYQVTIMVPITGGTDQLFVIDREVYSTQFWASTFAEETLRQITFMGVNCVTLEHPIELV